MVSVRSASGFGHTRTCPNDADQFHSLRYQVSVPNADRHMYVVQEVGKSAFVFFIGVAHGWSDCARLLVKE